MGIEKIFSNEINQKLLQQFLVKLRQNAKPEDSFSETRNNNLELILENMLKKPSDWEANCQINIKWIGNSLIAAISDTVNKFSKQELDTLYAYCFRFLVELFMSIKTGLSTDFESARQFAIKEYDKFDDNAKSQIDFALKDMPIQMVKLLIHHESIDDVITFNESIKKIKLTKTAWDKEIEEKQSEVNLLKENLDTYKNAYNFVGLYQGFNEMHEAKEIEKNNILKYLTLFGFLTVFPIFFELAFITIKYDSLSEINLSLIALTLPVISLVAVMIYYFRILLSNFKSTKSQLLQLELRKTLCQFIQNYAEYSSTIKEKDSSSLDKFENIIFSGIVSQDDKIPSTFDGMEGIAKLIESIKKS